MLEVYNLRHAKARNIIERIFGVLKQRFEILQHARPYSIEVQARLVYALCCLHNMLRDFDHEYVDPGEGEFNGDTSYAGVSAEPIYTLLDDDKDLAEQLREECAQAMWEHSVRLRGNRRFNM